MADFFAKGNKPISGYGALEHGIYELWVNSSPTSAFAGQTLNIDIDKTYDAIMLDYGEISGNTYRALGTLIIEIGREGRANYVYMASAGKIGELYRMFTATINGSTLSVVITDCTARLLNSYGSAPTTSTANTELFPYRILGLIHND